MKLKDKFRVKQNIRATARQFGVTPAQSRAEMQKSIDEAWENSLNDPVAMAYWRKLFPNGRKPTVEEFIVRISTRITDSNNE